GFPELREECVVKIACRAALRAARLQSFRHQRGVQIQRKVFDGVAVAEANSLPAGCRTALDDEQRGASAVKNGVVEQGPQNFFLRSTRLDGSNRLLQACRRTCAVVAAVCQGGSKFA